MSSLVTFPSRPWGKWIVFAAWIAAVLAITATRLPERFTDAERNESSSFLPDEAESTRALAVTERLQAGEIAPTVVVYRRDGGLTEGDLREIARDTAELNRITRRYANTTPFGRQQL